jgi:hypothetical protein
MHKKPIWDITKSKWIDHKPNPRFAIYHPGPSRDKTEDVVLDKETGLVWERVPNAERKTWDAAIVYSYAKAVAARKGWRLPSIEELLSLVDPTRSNPTLPGGHPFVNVGIDYFYWSSTLGMSSLPTYAWGYNFGNANTSNVLKVTNCYVWLVRGGSGHDYPY